MQTSVSHTLVAGSTAKRPWLPTRPGAQGFIQVSPEDTHCLYALVEMRLRPGDGTPLHVHGSEDEHVFVVAGTARVAYGGNILDVQAGHVATLCKGMPHAWDDRSHVDVRLV